MRRRDFIGGALASLVASPVLALGRAVGGGRTTPAGWPPAGPFPTLDVRKFGAVGDGVSDDTAAFARTTAEIARAGGGTIVVSAGTYLIDADFRHGKAIRLPSGCTLQMQSGAVLQARPNALTNSAVVYLDHVTGCRIVGGTIRGERAAHLGRAGEWGMGVQMNSVSRCTISDTVVRDCWGDGIYLGATAPGQECTDVVISHVSCLGNRRQGMSVVSARRVLVESSLFSGTSGTSPGAGLDFEPDVETGVVEGGTVRDCRFVGNDIGMQFGSTCRSIVVRRNRFEGNRRYGINVSVVAVDAVIDGNEIVQADDHSTGIFVGPSRGCRITNNVIRGRFDRGIALPASTLGLIGGANRVEGNRELRGTSP